LQTGDLGTGDRGPKDRGPGTRGPGTRGPGTGNFRVLYKDGPLCPKEREEKEKKGKKERKRRRRIWKRQDLCGKLEETRPAAEDTEDQCKVISNGSGDF